jgi:hypothetical protein
LEDLEQRILDFKIEVSSNYCIDFPVYIVIAAIMYFVTSMIVVSLILYDTKTVDAFWAGGFAETLSAYNVFLAIVTIAGYSSMYLFVNILTQIYSAQLLQEKLGYSLKSTSKIVADTLFWICVVFMIVSLCIKWPYIPIILYIVAILLLILTSFLIIYFLSKLILVPLKDVIKSLCDRIRAVVPWLFIDEKSNVPHSPTYFIVYFLFHLMDKVTKMDDEVRISAIKGTTLGIHGIMSLWIVVILVFAFTIKSDPSTVYVCVGTETIVLTVSFMSSVAAILAKPILVFLYGSDDLFEFRPQSVDSSTRGSQRHPYDENPYYAHSEVDDMAASPAVARPAPVRAALSASSPRNPQVPALPTPSPMPMTSPKPSPRTSPKPSPRTSPKPSPRTSPKPSPRRVDNNPPLPAPSLSASSDSDDVSGASTSAKVDTGASAHRPPSPPPPSASAAPDHYPAPEHHFEDQDQDEDDDADLSSAIGDNAVHKADYSDEAILDSDDDDTVG